MATKTLIAILESKLDRTGACWLWTGRVRRGCGVVRIRGRETNPRRLAYSLYIGPIPNGEDVSNWCRNQLCCQPGHLKVGKNVGRRPQPPEAVYRERFWRRVNRSGECWLWQGGKDRNGYGRFCYRGKTQPAHRVSYLIANDEIPQGHWIRQACGSRLCVRPLHLVDTLAVGPWGLKSKIPSPEEVKLIRRRLREPGTYAAVGREFGVTEGRVGRINRGSYRIGRE